MPDDDTVLDQIRVISRFLKDIGLERYEISNYAIPGRECRHNLATWRGEDYIGLGEGAHGRTGRLRTQNWWENWWGHSPQTDWGQALQIGGQAPQIEGQAPQTDWGQAPQVEEISEDFDNKERKIFALRTKFGLDTTDHPAWRPVLDEFVAQGLLTVSGMVYRLTERGTEVCDTILAAIV